MCAAVLEHGIWEDIILQTIFVLSILRTIMNGKHIVLFLVYKANIYSDTIIITFLNSISLSFD